MRQKNKVILTEYPGLTVEDLADIPEILRTETFLKFFSVIKYDNLTDTEKAEYDASLKRKMDAYAVYKYVDNKYGNDDADPIDVLKDLFENGFEKKAISDAFGIPMGQLQQISQS
ncbi:hypothetical protein [Lonepinella sp. BR2357]|uniref:hypothetical protein n=1 Tax=Lonepinella sp. BR2357 TaxID=3434549 RepID=UPI003F6DB17A